MLLNFGCRTLAPFKGAGFSYPRFAFPRLGKLTGSTAKLYWRRAEAQPDLGLYARQVGGLLPIR